MSAFLFGLVAGVLLGGFVIDVNLRAPDAIKTWFASWFPKTNKTDA